MVQSNKTFCLTLFQFCAKLYRHLPDFAYLLVDVVDVVNLLSFVTDRVQEGMRELEQLKDKRDVNICSIMALIFAHKKCKSLGK